MLSGQKIFGGGVAVESTIVGKRGVMYKGQKVLLLRRGGGAEVNTACVGGGRVSIRLLGPP